MSIVCPRCGSEKVHPKNNKFKCSTCHNYFCFEDTLLPEGFVVPEVFSGDDILRLKAEGRHSEVRAYLRRREEESVIAKNYRDKERSIGVHRDRTERLVSLGLCKNCGKHPIHRANLCESCYNKKRANDKKYKKNYEQRRKNKMEETIVPRVEKQQFDVGFQKVSSEQIPYSQEGGMPGVITRQAMAEMLIMSPGDALKIPIGEKVPKEHRKSTKSKYVYSCRLAAKRIEGTFKIMERGEDIYVKRTA